MEKRNHAKIRSIKSKVITMLRERQSLENNEMPIAAPSTYWSNICSHFDYMLGLSEESFAKLRLHTYHLTGDNYQSYYFGDPERFLKSSRLDVLTKDIPSTYILNEPEGGIGFRYDDGRFLSRDIVRYQRTVSTFYRYGILSDLLNASKRCYVLDIGGGYGGLAHHLSNICRNATYILVDLPETLLFSASYLSLLNPQKKIYIYEPSDFPKIMRPGAVESYDFVLLPNYRLQSLTNLHFDLIINVASLQEMTTGQVEMTLDFIRDTCRGTFYSWNRDHQPRNKELSNLSELLRQRFDLIEVLDWEVNKTEKEIEAREKLKSKLREILKSIAILVGLLSRPEKASSTHTPVSDLPYREYICKPLPPSHNSE